MSAINSTHQLIEWPITTRLVGNKFWTIPIAIKSSQSCYKTDLVWSCEIFQGIGLQLLRFTALVQLANWNGKNFGIYYDYHNGRAVIAILASNDIVVSHGKLSPCECNYLLVHVYDVARWNEGNKWANRLAFNCSSVCLFGLDISDFNSLFVNLKIKDVRVATCTTILACQLTWLCSQI